MRDGNGFGADDRRALREQLIALGLTDKQLLEPMAIELRQRRCRARTAWRLANDFTQAAVADRYNEIVGDQAAMRASRISEYEAWPSGREGPGTRRPAGVRPTMAVLKHLATIYGTTWDQLVDAADLEYLPAGEKRELCQAWAKRSNGRSGVAASGELPTEVPYFTGRDIPKGELHERVVGHVQGRVSPVHVIDGPPGVGKTVLARYAVAAFARHYPDGTIWIDMHGHTVDCEPREPADVLERLLLELGVPPESIEADPALRADQWRVAMSQRRMLLVFDNVLDSEQVKSLLPLADRCFVLITSRARLTGLAGSSPLHLGVMAPQEAEELLVELADLPPDYDADAVRQILETTGGLPLAIRLIAGQIAHHGEDLLADTANEFADNAARLRQSPADYILGESAAEGILDRFTTEGESLLAAYEGSYQRMRDPVQRRALRLLGWNPGSEITADTITMLAAVPNNQAKALLRKLFEAGFLDYSRTGRTGGRRYRLHDLTRLFARVHAEQEDSPSDHAAAIARLVAGNLATARRMRRPELLGPGTRHAHPKDMYASAEFAQADGWLIVERENLLAILDAASPTAETAELARLLAPALWGLGWWSDAHRLYDRALQAARHIGDQGAEAYALLELGRIDQIGGFYGAARTGFRLARRIAVAVGDPRCQTEALCELGQTAWLIGDHGDAERFYTKALRMACEIDYPPAECDARNGLGHVERLACKYEAATEHFKKSWAIAFGVGDRARAASALWGHAEVVRRLGDNATARQNYTDALRTARQINHPKIEGDALRGLGHIARLAEDWDAARRYYEDALEIACHIRDRHGEVWSLWGLGHVERNAGEFDGARQRFSDAYDIAIEINLALAQEEILRGIGHLERQLGNYDAARRRYLESLCEADRINNCHGRADVLRSLGHVAADTGCQSEACAALAQACGIYESIGVPLAYRVRAEMREIGCPVTPGP
ncbi:tetratricopeptide repeat protein [Nocardia nepalensis]|uniref:tetratricopeptide repeat protein n=1 Tax=Nocardia nepalensis TaxID=3375448 RepID=UPI003B678153